MRQMWERFLPSPAALSQKMRPPAFHCVDKQAHYDEDLATNEAFSLKSTTEQGCRDTANGARNFSMYE